MEKEVPGQTEARRPDLIRLMMEMASPSSSELFRERERELVSVVGKLNCSISISISSSA